ncbi:MAG TPA: citrate synthase [Armatimonadetes bacterium]|nr:citrate synthase [Armatimonadota bacterium]
MGVQYSYRGKLEWPITVSIDKGLEGAITNETQIGYIDGQRGLLIYRGYDIRDLAAHSTFEETTYLLLLGRLPHRTELEEFQKKLASYRGVPEEVMEVLRRLPVNAHPMALLQTGVAALGTFDDEVQEAGGENCLEVGLKIIAQTSTLVGAIARLRRGENPLPPPAHLPHAANLFYLMTGEEPDELTARVMDLALILHADHGMNASTFTGMVIASSLSDLYSAICGAIGSLKGPLHGGANERALIELLNMKDEEDAVAYVHQALKNRQKIMGFGHRVYKTYDPRALILKQYAQRVTERRNLSKLYAIAQRVEEEVVKAYGEKGIFPNVDFYSGIIYHALGLEPPLFTPIFAASRVAGWVARVLEYLPENRIFRPRAAYIGPLEERYVPLVER